MKKKIDKILEISLVILMSVLVLDVLWQVASRYILRHPSAVTDELAGYLLVWVGLTGAAYATGAKEHLAIDLLHSRLSPRNLKRIQVLIDSLIILFAFSVLIIGGTWLVWSRFQLGQVSAATELPVGYVYLILPVSGLLIVYYSLYYIQKNIRS